MVVCRACLVTGTGMVPMDETFITNYNIITSLDLKHTEGIPLYACRTCFDGANFCIEFREKCIASDQSFRTMLNSSIKKENDENEIINEDIKQELEEFDIIEDYLDEWKNDDNADYLELLPETDVTSTRQSSRLKEKKNKNETSLSTTDINRVKLKNDDDKIVTKTKKLTFDDDKVVIKTEKLTDDDGKIHCGLCIKQFHNNVSLAKHLESHRSDIVCRQCQECFFNWPHLLSHRLIHVPKNQKQCHMCSKKFLTATSLEYHYMRIHEMAEKNAPIICKICHASFGNSRKLRKHISCTHAEIKYRCSYCDKGFCVKSCLIMHMGVHKMVTYECDECDFTCNFRSGLASHKIRRHTDTKVLCVSCKHVFKDQKGLDRHICKNLGASFVCSVCGKEFKFQKLLNRHMNVHNDICPYKCDKCPSKFKTSGSYRAHMDKHAGKPRFHCQYCQRSFYSGSVLIKHRRIHTGEKPYVCSICNKGFTGHHNLKVHMKVHGMQLVVKKSDTEDKLPDFKLITSNGSKKSAASKS